jgi:murein DD-endopeptidase MepM/ murein hydrolase activator NlpD
VEKPTSSFYTQISTIISKVRSKVSYSALLGILVGLALTIMTIDIYADSHSTYIVKVDSNSIGYVNKIDEFNYAVEAIKLTDGADAASHLTVSKTREAATELISSYDIERIARQSLNLKMNAVSMVVNGEEIFKLRSQGDVDKVLDEIKKHYIADLKAEAVSILSSNVQEKIETKSILVDPQEVLDINGAVQKIIAGRGEQKKYKIKQGDTIWDIAMSHGISIDEMHAANPDVNLDKIKIDQEINLAVNIPYLNVEIVANVINKENVPYSTQTITDKNVAKGVTKVKQDGKSGKSEIEKKVTVVNGMTMAEDVIKTTVIAAAVDKVVVVGSKAPVYNYAPASYVASAGSGQFGWPSRGSISSRFGYRGREFHTGLDIASPTGTPVSAADSGTVTFAGWSGSYGKIIKINHGNGYETWYAHLSSIDVSVGQKVSKGEVIGKVGSTGRSTGPHLHFEVRKNGTPQNPLSFLN